MTSQPSHEADLVRTIREGRAVIVAGTGVSMAATFDATTKQAHPQASWVGLLENGLQWLRDHRLIDDDVADAHLKLVKKRAQTHHLISAAEDVTAQMGGARSRHFANWLEQTVGSIKARDRRVLDALDAIRRQGNLLATTNYDGLLLGSDPRLEPVTWQETDALLGAVRAWDTGKVIFLHGYWRKPESVILDWKSYDRIARDDRYREALAAFWKTHVWVYVGCGVNGLGDPDFGLLLDRYGERARHAGHWDYCLVRDDQRDEFQAHFDTNQLNIRAIPIGKTHADVPDYLRSLLPAPVLPAPVVPAADTDPEISSRSSKMRALYLKDARRDIEARLAASIHHARFVDLGIQADPAAIKPAWGYHNPDIRQSYETVSDAFNGCERRLLLLGLPGSGKTTALLHLAKLLVDEAEQSPRNPVPFVVNLSKFRFDSSDRSESSRRWPSFAQRRGASGSKNHDESLNTEFEDWLVAEIAAFPGLSRDMAREWVRQGRVAALLDGLDEFNDERRADLVRVLNSTFLRTYPEMTVVVCSRENEYLVLQSAEETRLQLRGCVHLQPLSDEQIGAYLDAARAGALLDALPNDPALLELARTPLTLSMLVLAYGGLAPGDLPTTASLSERRHHLFESYVARMLQRRERRKRGIPFDDSRANDVPIGHYSYHPDQVHRWLGWLALALSVRMRTSFSTASFHNILSVGGNPDREPFNFYAVHLAMGALLSIALGLMALPIVPRTPAGMIGLAVVIVALFLVLVLSASSEHWIGGAIFLMIAIPAVFLLDTTAVAHVLSHILPGSISPLALSLLVPFAAGIAAFAASNGFGDDEFQKLSGLFIATVVAVISLQFLPRDQQLPVFDTSWWQAMIVMLSLGIGGIILMPTEGLRERIAFGGSAVGIAVIVAGTVALVRETDWRIGYVANAAPLPLMLPFLPVPAAVLVVLGYSVCAFLGGIFADAHGAILGVIAFGLLCSVGGAVKETLGLREMEVIKRLSSRNAAAAGGTVTLVDRMILSPCLWRIVAMGRRFPWCHHRFISFCNEAFLMKQSSQEHEFIHRLLRDYFALRELRPGLSEPETHRRLEAIRLLGYQGEAALDVLVEFADHQEPAVRAAALTGLGHIASPVASRCLRLHVIDRDPLVRQAIIPGILRLPEYECKDLLARLDLLGDGCELEPLLAALQTGTPWSYRTEIHRLIGQIGQAALEPLRERLRSRYSHVRRAAVDVLAEVFSDEEERRLLSESLDGRWPWLDPAKPISRNRVVQCTRRLNRTEDDVLAGYRSLARFGFKVKV
jgi:hypothetical protein